jgi:hypothetical protein
LRYPFQQAGWLQPHEQIFGQHIMNGVEIGLGRPAKEQSCPPIVCLRHQDPGQAIDFDGVGLAELLRRPARDMRYQEGSFRIGRQAGLAAARHGHGDDGDDAAVGLPRLHKCGIGDEPSHGAAGRAGDGRMAG